MSNLQMAIKYLLYNCHDDDVGLWDAISDVKEAFPNAPDEEIRQLALELFQKLLEAGLIKVGFPEWDDAGKLIFVPWSSTPNESITRIKSEWDALGRKPTLGDVCWFRTTEKGDREVEKLKTNKHVSDDEPPN